MELRFYQTEAVEVLLKFYLSKSTDSGLCVLPTASGKTIIFSEFIRQLIELNPKSKVLILGHTQEIVQQNEDKLLQVWPEADVGVFCSGLNRKEVKQITSASRDSMVNDISYHPEWDVVVIDEAHLISPLMVTRYQKILQSIKLFSKQVKVIGFTATPFRTQTGEIYGNGAGSLFKKLLYRRRIDELINTGHLCPVRAVVTDKVAIADTSEVRVNKNDFIQTDLDEVTVIDSLVESIVQDWLNKTSAKVPTVFFACSVAQGRMFEHYLTELGFDYPLITAKTAKLDRQSYLAQFNSGELNGLVNVTTLTTGWDAPRLSCIVLARPTMSPGLFLQIVGRGLRLFPNKGETLLLDYGENLQRFGVIERVRPVMEERKKFFNTEQIQSCETCDTIVSAYEFECPFCTETLKDEDYIRLCYECNSGNDLNAEFCEVCGEVLTENILTV